MTDNNNSRLGLDQAAAGQGSAHNAAQQIVRLRERASAVIQAGAMLKSRKAHICAQTCDAQMLMVSSKMREYSTVKVKDLLKTNLTFLSKIGRTYFWISAENI